MNGGEEKPFACPVPGCKKRYKVRWQNPHSSLDVVQIGYRVALKKRRGGGGETTLMIKSRDNVMLGHHATANKNLIQIHLFFIYGLVWELYCRMTVACERTRKFHFSA